MQKENHLDDLVLGPNTKIFPVKYINFKVNTIVWFTCWVPAPVRVSPRVSLSS